jgi:photosystem II stability/assembly factor-like uncharacterized protein
MKTLNSFKKVIFIFLIGFFPFTCIAQYDGGSGSEGAPYIISSSDKLVKLCNTPADWNQYFELSIDIDMSGKTFTPIGNATNPFNGGFNGNKHVISNLTITAPKDKLDGTGMFGVLNGKVSNLGIINVFGDYTSTAFSNWTRVGVFAGILNPGASIKNCYSKGGTLKVSGGWTGGIAGIIFASTTPAKIEDCYSSTTITGNYGCGGILGLNRGPHIINRVAYYGTISGGNAILTIQNDPTSNIKNGIAPTNSNFATSTSATDNNATGLNSSELLLESNYDTFDFSNVWKMNNSQGYAILNTTIPETPFFDKIITERVTSSTNINWINIAPGTSGYCEEFWCHPTDANTMFSGADMHAAFGSWDGGKTWQTIKDSDGSGLHMRRVIDIQFSLQNPNYGIAFSNNQTGSNNSGSIYETTDKGRTWSVVSNMGKCHSKLAIHPENDNIWFLGAGDFWNIKANHRSAANPNGIKQSRSNYGYVWKTTNKGANWTKVATNIAVNDLDVGRIIFDRNNPNNLIMATSHGMFRSTDLGDTWSSSATGLPNNLPRDLTSFYNSATQEFTLYAIDQTVYTANGNSINSTGGIYKSVDTGLTWQSITGNLALNMQSITDYNVRESYHRTIANWFGISKSDSKSTYTSYPTSALPTFNRIVINPNNKEEIYIVQNKRHSFSFGPGDVWKTVNGGTTWIACSRSGTYWINEKDKSYWQSRNNPTGANIDFSHMQRYMDEGIEESSAARMLAINTNGNIFTGINQQLLRSNNNGSTWTQIDDDETSVNSNSWVGRGNTNLPGRVMLLETGVTGRKLLASGEHGLWKTTDLGNYPNPDAVAVQQIEGQVNHDGAHSIATVAVHPTNPNMIYTLQWRQEHRGKLRRSTDGGGTWSNIATIFEASNNSWEGLAYQNSLIIDPNTPNNMYFCATRKAIAEVSGSIKESILTKGGYGVYKSTDGGFNWSLSNSGLPANSSIRRLTMDPTNPNTIYASLNQFGNNDPGGLYKSTNGTNSWTQVTIPTDIKSVNNFFIDRNTGFMFISAGARSGELKAGGVWKSENNGTSWTRIFEAPYVWQTEVSPVNSNIIVISVPAQIPNMVDSFLNPGVYVSFDAGENWTKSNQGLAHAERTVDVKPDPVDEKVLWCAGWGSGWYKAIIKEGSLSTTKTRIEEVKMTLYPNPVNNGVLQFKNIQANSKFVIYDIRGKNILTGNISENKSIDVSKLSSGVYMIRVLSNKTLTMKTRKFIVE